MVAWTAISTIGIGMAGKSVVIVEVAMSPVMHANSLSEWLMHCNDALRVGAEEAMLTRS